MIKLDDTRLYDILDEHAAHVRDADKSIEIMAAHMLADNKIKALMLELIGEASIHPEDPDLQTYDDYGIAITYTDKLRQKVQAL